MGFFSKIPKRYVPEASFQENLAKQVAMTPMTLEQLRKLGVTPERELKLEYFFTRTRRTKPLLSQTHLGRKHTKSSTARPLRIRKSK